MYDRTLITSHRGGAGKRLISPGFLGLAEPGLYDLELGSLERRLKRLGANRVLLQAPDGLKRAMLDLAAKLSSTGREVVLSAGSCHGGCDVAFEEAKTVQANAIVHMGHSRMVREHPIPTIYLECRYTDPSPLLVALEDALSLLKTCKCIGLGVTAQWLDFTDIVQDFFRERGLTIVLGSPRRRAGNRCQVLGCEYSALERIKEKVDCLLTIGSVFHGLGAALSTNLRTIAVEPHSQRVEEMGELRETVLRQRYASITRFQEAHRIGVILSTKPGQRRPRLATHATSLLRDQGRAAFQVTANEVTESALAELGFDGYVNTACPRVSIEDGPLFSAPLLLPSELLVSLGFLPWEELINKGLLLDMSPKEMASK